MKFVRHTIQALVITSLFVIYACGSGADGPEGLILGADSSAPPSAEDASDNNERGLDSDLVDALAATDDVDSTVQGNPLDMDGLPARHHSGHRPSFGGMSPRDGMSDPTCYDGIDTNGDGNVDCDDPRCHTEFSCCVNSGDCCAIDYRAPVPSDLDFSTCRDLATCFPTYLVPFGDSRPRVMGGYFHPGGDQDSDSGVKVGRPLNTLSGRIELTADFVFPRPCGASCLESAAVGLTAQPDLDGAPIVLPAVALLASGSRQQVSLIVNGDIIASWDTERSSPGWTLIVRPTGEVEVLRSGVSLLRGVPFSPHPTLQLVLYGRNRSNAMAGGDGMFIRRVTTSVASCDISTAWSAPPAEIQSTSWTPSPLIGAPSFARESGHPDVLAVEDHDGIHLLESFEGAWIATNSSGRANITGSVPHDEAGVSDPDLVWADGMLHVYYSALSETGYRTIGLARASGPGDPFTAASVPVLSDATDREFVSYASPSVVLHPSGTWVMVAVGTRADGSQSLPVFVSPDGVIWARLSTSSLGSTIEETFGAASGSHSFADPDLMLHANVWYLHLSHLRGARWRIDALVSDQLLFWRELGQVLRGGTSRNDRLGVSAPEARLVGQRMELYYVGHDGSRQHILQTDRSSTPGGVFPSESPIL